MTDSQTTEVSQSIQPAQTKRKSTAEQEPKSVKGRLICCIPTDPYTLLFGVVALACTFVGVLEFAHTGSTTLLITLISIVSGHTGLQKVRTLLPKKQEIPPEEPGAA